jgi:YgiT-type zinc finger domain-containing protein
MARVYHKCHFCGGEVSERKITVDYRWGEELVTIIKNVPAGVCEVCGGAILQGPDCKEYGASSILEEET